MITTKKLPLLGAHMSISDGLEQAIINGESIGCTAIQMFTKSNRSWYAKKITPEQEAFFKKRVAKSSIKVVVVHASYLINLTSSTPAVVQKSIKALTDELNRCNQLDIPYLVLHPGSYAGPDKTIGLNIIAQHINTILETTKSKTMILLEIMAGQGNVIGSTFEEIAIIINLIKKSNQVGVCFDTCHAFAAGYDLRTKTNYQKVWDSFNKIIGINKLKVIHMNDSKKNLGSHVDRHETIGKGHLKLKAFSLIMNDKRFTDIPKILETPKTSLNDDEKNMTILKSLLSK